MATSTEQINTLIASNTALMEYFQGARDQIDADLDAAALRVGDTNRLIYVDQTNGDDANDGTVDAPVQTLTRAKNMSVYNGVLDIRLKSDYHHDKTLIFRNGQINIRSDTGGVKRKFTSAPVSVDTATSTPSLSNGTGYSMFLFKDIELEMCTAGAGVVSKRLLSCTGLTSVMMIDCDITLPAGSDQCLMSPVNNHGMGLGIQSTTYPAEMPGRWIEGIAAATDPNTVRNLAFTNLTSL
ncbi:hypothetical protein AAFO90_23195 [Phaeobacter sp. CAU 1743]|uniref:hypothetical protein n=1 Tax=Phaeobacter sp. CAU 1743 TaxID=3140367 RepID=UPI0023B728D8